MNAPTSSDFSIRLYGMTGSGNCWKPATLMQQLEVPFEWIEVNILSGQSRTPSFLEKNANGRVPLLEVQDHGELRRLAESNAMLTYLAEGTHLLPDDRWQRAKIFEWLFFEQYSHEPYIATVRFWVQFQRKHDEWKEKIADTMKKGHAALAVMEKQLAVTAYIAGPEYSIADIALYAYTHVAHEGGYELGAYPAIQSWLIRVAAQPRFKPMA